MAERKSGWGLPRLKRNVVSSTTSILSGESQKRVMTLTGEPSSSIQRV
jgi:hypothetical protein